MIKGEKDLGTRTYPTHVHPPSCPEYIQKKILRMPSYAVSSRVNPTRIERYNSYVYMPEQNLGEDGRSGWLEISKNKPSDHW